MHYYLDTTSGSSRVDGVPRIEGTSSSPTEKTKWEELALIINWGQSYLCQQFTTKCPFYPQIENEDNGLV